MLNWLCKYILGLENTLEVLRLNVRFVWGIPAWAFILLLVALGAGVVFLYRREGGWLSRREHVLLSALRIAGWALVLWIVLQPVLIIERLIVPKSTVGVLLDTSQSMTFKDTGAPQEYYQMLAKVFGGSPADTRIQNLSRREIVDSVFNNEYAGVMRRLEENYALRYYSFDADLNELDIGRLRGEKGEFVLPPMEGQITQLGQALRMGEARLRGLPVSGLIIFTDGGNNRGQSPLEVARLLGERGLPVFTVGIGATASVDVEVMETNIPDVFFKDDELPVRVTFNASAAAGKRTEVTLKLDEEVLLKEQVTLVDGVSEHEFVIKPKNRGDFNFSVTAAPLPGEAFIENNTISKRVRVIDDAIRILIAIDTPSWEYRYLKGFLNSDERIKTKVYIHSGDPRRSRVDDQYLEKFPDYDDLRRNYDCIILNNIPAEAFTSRVMEDMRKFVADEGGALIMISAPRGTPGTYAGTVVEQMLPVSFRRISEDVSLDYSSGSATTYSLALTREGQNHVITRLSPKQDENSRIWAGLPGQYWYYTGIRQLKPTAISLAEHSTARNEFGRIPLIAFQRYGKGQVLFMGINSVWRWRYKVGNRFTNRFWGQTIQFMGLPHRLGHLREVQFQMQGRDFLEGEQIPLTVSVVTRDYLPYRAESVNIVAVRGDGAETVDFPIRAEQGKSGIFAGNIALRKGTWRLFVEGRNEQGDLVLDIREPRLEYEKPAMQKELLTQVAQSSGGRFIELDEIGGLPQFLAERSKPARERSEIPLWDFWWLFVLVLLAASGEWIYRKFHDLP